MYTAGWSALVGNVGGTAGGAAPTPPSGRNETAGTAAAATVRTGDAARGGDDNIVTPACGGVDALAGEAPGRLAGGGVATAGAGVASATVEGALMDDASASASDCGDSTLTVCVCTTLNFPRCRANAAASPGLLDWSNDSDDPVNDDKPSFRDDACHVPLSTVPLAWARGDCAAAAASAVVPPVESHGARPPSDPFMSAACNPTETQARGRDNNAGEGEREREREKHRNSNGKKQVR